MEAPIKKPLYKRIFTFGHASFALAAILVLVTAYSLFGPITPAAYNKPTIVDTNPTAGKTITYKMYACRYVGDAVVTTITRKLVSTTDKQLAPILLSSDTTTNERRCLDTTRTLVIPSDTPAGEYQLMIQGVYQIIPLRAPITVQATTDSFVISPANPNDPFVQSNSMVHSTPVSGSGSSPSPKASGNSGGSPAQVAQPSVTNNTTNNTTNNNPAPVVQGSPSEQPEQGLIPDLIHGLTGIRFTL